MMKPTLFIKSKPKTVKKIKAYFVENLPINFKIIILEDLLIKENDNVIVNGNVFKISQKINKHPIKKTFESCKYWLTLVDQLRNLPKFQELILNCKFKYEMQHFLYKLKTLFLV